MVSKFKFEASDFRHIFEEKFSLLMSCDLSATMAEIANRKLSKMLDAAHEIFLCEENGTYHIVPWHAASKSGRLVDVKEIKK